MLSKEICQKCPVYHNRFELLSKTSRDGYVPKGFDRNDEFRWSPLRGVVFTFTLTINDTIKYENWVQDKRCERCQFALEHKMLEWSRAKQRNL